MESRNEFSWLQDDEYEWLMSIAEQARGDFVELGTFRGGTTAGLRRHLPEDSFLWSVDNYTDPEFIDTYLHYNPLLIRNKFFNNVDGVFLIVGDSISVGHAWNTPIWAVFIDACHDFESTLGNFLQWSSHLVPGGLVIFHDNHPTHAGVVRALAYILEYYKQWEIADSCNTMVAMKRKGE